MGDPIIWASVEAACSHALIISPEYSTSTIDATEYTPQQAAATTTNGQINAMYR